jgi:Uma2 family endonuclease
MLMEKTVPQESKVRYWPPRQGEWTYDDYSRLPDNGFRYEVIEGELFMSPAPTIQHQRILFALIHQLANHLEQRKIKGEALAAPVDVNLPGVASPVQPDLLYVSEGRLHFIKEQTIEGAPDLIIEILSPSTAQYDRQTKFQAYARAGVREYWLVDPEQCLIEIYVLRGHAYALLGSFGPSDTIRSEVLPEFSLLVSDIC